MSLPPLVFPEASVVVLSVVNGMLTEAVFVGEKQRRVPVALQVKPGKWLGCG